MKIIRLAAALLMLRDKILYVTSGDYRGFRTLLQNCRIVICHRTNVPITYNYLETEIKIDTIMAWEIMGILARLNIEEKKKKKALENFINEIKFREKI